MNFWRVVEILGKRKWLILFSVLVASALTAGGTHLVGSRWIATVQLVVPQGAAMLRGANPMEGTEAENASAVQTASKDQIAGYLAVVRTRDVIEPALKELGLTQIPANLFSSIAITASSPRIFQLTFTDSSRERAEKMANAIAVKFIDQYQNLNSVQMESVVSLLASQLQINDTKLAAARRRVDQYRATHNIDVTVANNLEMALARLKDNRQRLDDVSQKLAESQAQLTVVQHEVVPTPRVPVSGPVVDPAVALLQSELDAAEKSLTDLRTHYTDSWPEVKKANTHRDDVKNRLKLETAKPHSADAARLAQMQDPATIHRLNINKLQEDISGDQARLVALGSAILSAQQEVDHLKGIDSQMSALTVDITDKTEMHGSLVTRLNRAQMMLDSSKFQDPITIMDKVGPYNPPINSTPGRTVKLTLLGALCALLLTSAILISLDSVDRRLKTVSEAEIVLPTRVVAAIPQPMGRVTYGMMSRATELQPQSLHAEAYRFLGMHVLNQPPHVRSFMMLSAKAEQGSTTSITNLGITLAQAGKTVILVDANIRTSELHQAFDLPNTTGFTDLITNFDRLKLNSVLQRTAVTNLSVITSGNLPANPWELFRSPKLEELSRQMLAQADYVLYDTPSALMFTDALNLAPVVDAAYLCVRAFEPLSGGEKRVIEFLEGANVLLLGSILTDVPASVIEGYHNYQHYYAPPTDGGDKGVYTTIDGKNLVGPAVPVAAAAAGAQEESATA